MDSIVGGAGDDIINALAVNATTGAAQTSINSGDVIDGGAGNDTLNITATAANNTSLSGLSVSNVEVININGANNLGTVTPGAATAAAGAAAVRVLDISAAQRTGEVQTLDFSGVSIATAGNISLTSTAAAGAWVTSVALAAGDGPAAIASKVATGLASVTGIASVTTAGSLVTVTFNPSTGTGTSITDYNPGPIAVATSALSSPVTLASGALPAATTVRASDASTVSVTVNGVSYTSGTIVNDGQYGTARAAPTPPTVSTVQGIAATTESSVVTFSALTIGQSITVNGLTLVAGTGGVTAANAAAYFFAPGVLTLPAGASAIGANDATKFAPSATSGSTVTFTSATANQSVTDIAISSGAISGYTAPAAPAVVTTQGSAASSEVSTVTFGALTEGQTVTVNGVTYTGPTGGATAVTVAAAIVAAGGANNGFGAPAAGTASGTVVYTAAAAGALNDVVISTGGANSVTTSQVAAQANTRDAVKAVLATVLGGTVTIANGDDAGEIKLTSNAVGVDIPTITVTQGTTLRSSVDTADGATVANAARTSLAGATKQVMTITVSDATPLAADTFTVYINGQGYSGTVGLTSGTNAPATAIATYASQVASVINSVLGTGVASASGDVVTVTAPVAGTPLPHMSVAGGDTVYTFAQSAANQQLAVSTTSTFAPATIAGANFTGATQVWLQGASGSTNLSVSATQTAGLDGVTGLANTIAFGTTGNLAVKASAGTVTVTGAASGLTVSGTTTATGGLVLQQGSVTATTGVKTLNVNMSGTSVFDVSGMPQLTSVNIGDVGAVTINPKTNTKLASVVSTGTGADTVRIATATAIDEVATPTVNETVNAVVTTGAGADQVTVVTTGAGNTTITTEAGADVVYVQDVSTGTASISTGDDNDTVHLNVALGSRPGLSISAGAGTDTLVMGGSATFTATDYARMNAALSGFEAIRFNSEVGGSTGGLGIDASKLAIGTITGFTFNAGANIITEVGAGQTLTLARAATVNLTDFLPAFTGVAPTGLTASAAGYVVGSGSTATVYGGNLTVATSGSPTVALTLKGASATVGVTSTGASTDSASYFPTVTMGAAASDLQALTVNLTSARGTSTNAVNEYVATFNAGTITNASATTYTDHLEALASLKVNGSGAFLIDTGSVAATLAKLTTIDVSGMTAFADQDANGLLVTAPYLNKSTTSITLNNNVAETVILGGARDTVTTGSTFPFMDTVTGFTLTASSTTPTLVDTTRSDVLDVSGSGAFAKFTTTASSLVAALTAAGTSAAGNRLVFTFGGDTYVYVDNGTDGLDDSDGLVKLTGTFDLDLLIQTGVLI